MISNSLQMLTSLELRIKNLIEQYLNENDYVSWSHENILKYLLFHGVTDTYVDMLINYTGSVLTKMINNNDLNQNMRNKAKKLQTLM